MACTAFDLIGLNLPPCAVAEQGPGPGTPLYDDVIMTNVEGRTDGGDGTTLSGGEAQRVKLSTELSKRDTGNTFYILDEPTTGLHFEDIKHLLLVLNRLVDRGKTVLVIEHNMDVIKVADYVVDMGPEGGSGGGKVVGAGTPEDIAKIKESHTGLFLKEELR